MMLRDVVHYSLHPDLTPHVVTSLPTEPRSLQRVTYSPLSSRNKYLHGTLLHDAHISTHAALISVRRRAQHRDAAQAAKQAEVSGSAAITHHTSSTSLKSEPEQRSSRATAQQASKPRYIDLIPAVRVSHQISCLHPQKLIISFKY